ncbi:MAG: hypothetical protein HGB00_08380 [Chlorobiaceae bacterium]|nr:hypothetical protein [Chlorobiaceae bacterium]
MGINFSSMLTELEPEIRVEAQYVLYRQSLFLPLIMSKNTSGIPGLTTTFPKLGNMIAADVAETDETPETELNPDDEEIRVSEKELNVPITDMGLEAVGPDELIKMVGELLGAGMARKFDRDIAATFSQFTKKFGTAGNALTPGTPAKAVTYLVTQEAPGTMFGALHPYQALDIKESLTNLYGEGTKTPPSEMKANEILYQYYIGSLSGANFLETAAILPDANADAYGAVWTPRAIGANIKKLFELEYERSGKKRVTHILAHGMWGAKAINPLWGVGMFGDCSEPV